MTGEKSRFRLAVLGIIAVSLFSSLVARLWHLQALSAPRYEVLAEGNRLRKVALPSARGRILDRNGKVLVGNRSAHSITVDPKELGSRRDEILERLAALISSDFRPIDKETLSLRLTDSALSPYGNIVVADDVSRDKVVYLLEHQSEFPGVNAELRAVREYALGPGGMGALAPHVLGYLGQASPEVIAADPDYKYGDKVGRGGVEQTYDKLLRGEEGERSFEVTSRGKIVRETEGRPSIQGNDVVLTIDREIQFAAEEALAQGVSASRDLLDPSKRRNAAQGGAAAVVVDPTDGSILASASYPSYDLRAFTTGIDQGTWEWMNDPENQYPIQNRVIQGQYPPASTLKPMVAAAALREGMVTRDTTFSCPGKYTVPGDTSGYVFKDWTPLGHGSPDMQRAIAQSCDVYFYNLGWQFFLRYTREGRDVLQENLRFFGFGSRTGIDAPGEQAGRVPDPEWKIRLNENNPESELAKWYPGDNINLSVGQGDMLVTPLQLALAYGAFAANGVIYEPHLMYKVVAPDGNTISVREAREARSVPLSDEDLRLIREDLKTVVVGGGTGAKAFKGWPQSQIPVGGKTGTAEVQGKRDNSLFVGMGPMDNPRWVVAIVVEGGGHGSETAAPIARRIMEALARIPVTDIKSNLGGGGD